MKSISQLDYRSGYLQSPLWKEIRKSVIAHYGDKCATCGNVGGNDVHHVRYADVLGTENIEDYKVLCRECHEAHHKVCKKQGHKKRKQPVHAKAAYKALTASMKRNIADRFGIQPDVELYNRLCVSQDKTVMKACADMLGVPKVIHIVKGKRSKVMSIETRQRIRKEKKRFKAMKRTYGAK